MSELPEGWDTTTFGSICGNGQYGWTTKASSQGYVKYLRTTDITKSQIDWDSVPYCQETPNDLSKYQIQENDILISRAGSVGFSTLIGQILFPSVFASYLIRFIPSEAVDPYYVKYFLKSPEYWQQISEVSAGIALANVNAKKLTELSVPLPPLPEQHRIVAKLDSLFARSRRAREALERVPGLCDRYKQAVLAAAFRGDLTADWREQRNRDHDWKGTTVGELIDGIEAGINVKCEERPPLPHEFGLVKISAVTWGEFDDSKSKTLPPNQFISDSTRIKEGDFLISRANTLELVGACVIVKNVSRPVFLSDKVLRILVQETYKKWLLCWLRSKDGRSQIEELSSGNQLSMRNLSQANLKSITLQLPNEDERDEIIFRVEKLFKAIDSIAQDYQKARQLLDHLDQTTLAKAFRGELVPQDPNDEPAAALLERIQAERQAEPKGKAVKSKQKRGK
jgi:type I restriction enzyme, S subunit